MTTVVQVNGGGSADNAARNAEAIQAAEEAGATVAVGGMNVETPQGEPEGTAPQGTEQNAPENTPPADDGVQAAEQFNNAREANDEVRETLSKQGIDADALSDELAANGALSAKTYENLAKAGYSKQVVDQYIAGAAAATERYENAVLSSVGGRENFSKIATWAASNMPAAQVQAFNEAVQGGQLVAAQMLLGTINAAYVKAHGTANPSIMGAAATATQGFGSTDEMVAAMSDPRYKRGDKKYIREVEARIAASNGLF